jgi:hypothetical protein
MIVAMSFTIPKVSQSGGSSAGAKENLYNSFCEVRFGTDWRIHHALFVIDTVMGTLVGMLCSDENRRERQSMIMRAVDGLRPSNDDDIL